MTDQETGISLRFIRQWDATRDWTSRLTVTAVPAETREHVIMCGCEDWLNCGHPWPSLFTFDLGKDEAK